MGRLCTASLRWLVACNLFYGAFASKKKKANGTWTVPMPHHSFAAPMMYKSLLDDWVVSGASIFEPERLLLHPAVPERIGMVFSKSPVKSPHFEVIIHFRVTGEKAPTKLAADQSFAVWLLEDDVSKEFDEKKVVQAPSWTKALSDIGFTLVGSKAKFSGLGAVLSMSDAEKNQRPVVSLITNDGTKTLSFGSDVPAADAKAIDFRNTINAAQLRIHVSEDVVEGHLKLSPSLSWNECFRIDTSAGETRPRIGGHIGVTAWSGSAPNGELSDMISIVQMEVNNLDENTVGEDMKDVSEKIQEAYREMLTDENRHFVDQKSQMEHLKRLTVMLQDHAAEVGPADAALFQDLGSLEIRMKALDEDCRTLSKEFSILVNPAAGAGVGGMKDDVIGLRQLLSKDHDAHNMKIDAVSKNVKEVKEKRSGNPEALGAIAVQSQSLEKTVSARSSQMSGLLFCLIACVLIIGFLMWSRMSYYEKKHFI
eukprot:TRINITY_DN50539_c0_g1_i1.p1 TRINITY_DN50539_c0_g1~~TRINITY_DN50539_c0_g1_i1.p1  ORF type:complete len:481 (+),score=86.31 TRINITY_DN50539_c0_g1_i1:61-1503(+)